MRMALFCRFGLLVPVSFLLAMHATVLADISGINNLDGWIYNQADSGSSASLVDAQTIELTSGSRQQRSLFFNTPQDISGFEVSFTYRISTYRVSLTRQGMAFVIQTAGPEAVGDGEGRLGFAGIDNSAAISLFITTGPNRSWVGFFTDGVVGSGAIDVQPLSYFGDSAVRVTANYEEPRLTLTISDTEPNPEQAFSRTFLVGDLADTVGGDLAYVGFTASAGDAFGNGQLNQQISDFRFTSLSTSSDCNGDGILDVLDANCTDAGDLSTLLESLSLPMGDADGDGAVQLSDFLVLAGNFRKTSADYTDGDFDKSGVVDLLDLVVLLNNFGTEGEATTAVPEPTVWWMSWALFGIACNVVRRQKRNLRFQCMP